MKVQISDCIYDSEEEPIMIILNAKDKENIANMDPKATKFCSYPDNEEWSVNNIKEWMHKLGD